LMLAAVGLYGVTSYGVERRTNEIGVRIALGADRHSVMRMVLRAVGLQVAVGFAIGIPLTLAVGRVLAAQFTGVHMFDLKVFVVGTFALVGSAIVAGMIPARRAASIDPMQALRAE
jgi:ABC-type antimicrobial peptide transport system permease subunit